MPLRDKAFSFSGRTCNVKHGPDTGKPFTIVDWLSRADNDSLNSDVGTAASEAVERLILYGGPDPDRDYMLYGTGDGMTKVYHQDELDLEPSRMK